MTDTETTSPAARFRARPVEVEAARWDGTAGTLAVLASWGADPTPEPSGGILRIWGARGYFGAYPGDWLVRDADGATRWAPEEFEAKFAPSAAVMTGEQPARIRVTATDLDTLESSTIEITDDYVLICAGTCYREYVEDHFDGTHIITVKGRKQADRPPRPTMGQLWDQAGEEPDKYRRLLREHGYTAGPGDDGYDPAAPKLPPCGWGAS